MLRTPNNTNLRVESDIPQVENLPIDCIRPNPYQPRKHFTQDSLRELSESIRQMGLIQPIQVRRISGGTYELIAGERRLRASQMAGMTHILALVVSAHDQESALIAMVENLQRENLHFFEEAEGYATLLQDHSLTQEELARRLGKTQSAVANKVRLMQLSPKIRMMVVRNGLTERHARALLRIADEENRVKVVNLVLQRELTVRQTEELIEKMLRDGQAQNANRRMTGMVRDYRLFTNSLKAAVEQIRAAGILSGYEEIDHGDSLEIHMIVGKQSQPIHIFPAKASRR